MRKVIDGQVFDTDIATLVAAVQRDGVDEGQSLYQTPAGELFVYAYTPALVLEVDECWGTVQRQGVAGEITPVSADAPVVQAILRHVANTAVTTRVPLLP